MACGEISASTNDEPVAWHRPHHRSRREETQPKANPNFHYPQVPGLLGTTQNELGLRKWLEDQGHTLVTTSDKEGENSTFDKELVDAEIIITTP